MKSLEFKSPFDFLMFFGKAIAAMEHVEHAGLERAAQVIEDAAKEEFGVYQTAVGPFPAWVDLAESTKDDREAKGYSRNEPLLRSGELRDSIHHTTGATEAVIGSDDDVMVWQENGTPKIPPRPVLGPAAMRTEHEVGMILADAVVGAMLYGEAGKMLPLVSKHPNGNPVQNE